MVVLLVTEKLDRAERFRYEELGELLTYYNIFERYSPLYIRPRRRSSDGLSEAEC